MIRTERGTPTVGRALILALRPAQLALVFAFAFSACSPSAPEHADTVDSAPAPGASAPPSAAGSVKAPVLDGPHSAEALACDAATLAALKANDGVRLSKIAHPTKGIRFMAWAFPQDGQVVLDAAALERAPKDPTVRTWGPLDNADDVIQMTFAQFRQRYLYDKDYASLAPAAVNTTADFEAPSWNLDWLRESYREAFPAGSVMEHRSPPTNADAADWSVLRIICEPHEGRHYAVAISHSERSM
jgi:hypothetical protein